MSKHPHNCQSGYSGSDLRQICEKAASLVLDTMSEDSDLPPVSFEMLVGVLNDWKPSVGDNSLRVLLEFHNDRSKDKLDSIDDLRPE